MWGATAFYDQFNAFYAISIHAPRVGSDDAEDKTIEKIEDISIHAPRVGSDIGDWKYKTA